MTEMSDELTQLKVLARGECWARLLAAGHPLVYEFLKNLPPAAPCIFPQFRELHLWILIVECADSGVERDPSDGASGFLMNRKYKNRVCLARMICYRRKRGKEAGEIHQNNLSAAGCQ
jgi:hypothetical protein